jgi:hypothetical protein
MKAFLRSGEKTIFPYYHMPSAVLPVFVYVGNTIETILWDLRGGSMPFGDVTDNKSPSAFCR